MTWIGHLDLDAFFAKCEELRKPELGGRPLVVCVYTRGGSSGAVSTCNYEARKLGIDSGMPLSRARERASKETVFLPVDKDYYSRKSEQVISILRRKARKVEKYSIDEAFFKLGSDPGKKAREIKAEIEMLGLSSSIGISTNRFMAKMASEHDKPDGLEIVGDNEKKDFMSGRPVGDIHGVGSKTEQKLADMGLETCSDVLEANNSLLVETIGRKKTASIKAKARGEGSIDFSTGNTRMSKIVTMEKNSGDYGFVKRELSRACAQLYQRLKEQDRAFSNVGIVVIDTKLQNYNRSKSIKTSDTREKLFSETSDLLKKLLSGNDIEARRVGARVSGLVDRKSQTSLSSF